MRPVRQPARVMLSNSSAWLRLIVETARWVPAHEADLPSQAAGTVMTVAFRLDGQNFTALNGGPVFKFTEAMSLVISCKDQEEVDYYWTRLTAGGDPNSPRCGWLKDRFGVSWRVVPRRSCTRS
jgi:predicted 3-demethylubiquinone-9 3-methyltransferase (glyoxalase superfamily)